MNRIKIPILSVMLILSFLITARINLVKAGEMEDYGVIDVKNHQITGLLHAAGDGTTDDTAAIQAITRYAYENQYIVLFPAGTYRISDQIQLYNDAAQPGYTSSHGFWMFGSTSGARPTIQLASNSTGFNDPNNPKPIFKFWRINDNAANLFGCGIRNMNISVQSGNPGAIGIALDGHQRNTLEDISIDLTASGFAGFSDIPGMGATIINGIEVTGGDYGLYLRKPNRATVNNLTLTNQTKAAININSFWDVTIVGFKITKASAPAIEAKTSIGLIDGTIEFTGSSTAAAITNPNQANVTLYNVYFKNAPQIIQSGSQPAVTGNASGWKRVGEYYVPTTSTPSFTVSNGLVDTTSNQIAVSVTDTAPTEDLRLMHAPNRRQPSADEMIAKSKIANSGFCNALEPNDGFDIRANTTYNNQPELQRMINSSQCTTIFIPRGVFYVGSTLTLGAKTQLIGLAHNLSELTASDNNPDRIAGSWKPTANVDFVTTVNDANATTWISDVQLRAPDNPAVNDWFTILNWKAGRNSIVKPIDPRPQYNPTDPDSNPSPYLKISGYGGGKWFGVFAAGAVGPLSTSNPNKRRLLVDNTVEPMNLYNMNAEDGYGDYQIEFRNAKNVSIYGSKFEQYKGVYINGGNNIAYFGGHRGVSITLTNTNDILIAGIREGIEIIENYNGSTLTESLVGRNLAVLKRGTVNRIQIPANGSTGGCATKPRGDADCDADIDLVDFEIWRKEYIGTINTSTADFDSSGSVSLADFQTWRDGYFNPTGI